MAKPKRSRRTHRANWAGLYGTYLFKNKDPVIDELRTMLEDTKITYAQIHERSGVSTTTLRNWFTGPVKKPQSPTVEAVGRAMGRKRVWVKMSVNEIKF